MRERRVAAAAPDWLAPSGHLLVETSERQAPRTVEAFVRSGLVAWVARSEELDATVVIGARRRRLGAACGRGPRGRPGGAGSFFEKWGSAGKLIEGGVELRKQHRTNAGGGCCVKYGVTGDADGLDAVVARLEFLVHEAGATDRDAGT